MAYSRTFLSQTAEHLYMGVLMTAAYLVAAPAMVGMGYPGISALLFVELFVLSPLVIAHLFLIARRLGPPGSLAGVVLNRNPVGRKSFLLWYAAGLVAIFATYVPLYPIGILVREELFSWLPAWYFNPGFGTTDRDLIANLFLLGILVDGLIAPTLEEAFFRGYLLARMDYLKGWAPVVNGGLFGIYHFWQPHNLIALMLVGTILSWVVWKTKNVYLGVALHCTINVLGAAGGYFAVVNGVDIAR